MHSLSRHEAAAALLAEKAGAPLPPAIARGLGPCAPKRPEGEAIPDGGGSLFERATHWQYVDAAQCAVNRACDPVPQLQGPLEQYRMARSSYRPLASEWALVREAQMALNADAWRWFRAQDGNLVADEHGPAVGASLRRLESALAEYRRIGGALDRAPAVGAPG